jgi:hypothetical protein
VLRERERSLGIATDCEPEFGGVIGERISVTREQFAIAGFRLATQGLRVLGFAGAAQDAGELRRVIGIVGCERQRPKAGDGCRGLTQGSVEFASPFNHVLMPETVTAPRRRLVWEFPSPTPQSAGPRESCSA